jgi:hypothetical protein
MQSNVGFAKKVIGPMTHGRLTITMPVTRAALYFQLIARATHAEATGDYPVAILGSGSKNTTGEH